MKCDLILLLFSYCAYDDVGQESYNFCSNLIHKWIVCVNVDTGHTYINKNTNAEVEQSNGGIWDGWGFIQDKTV